MALERLAAAPAYFSAPLVSEDQHEKIAADFRAAVAMSRDLGLDRIVVADNVTRDRFLTAGRHTDNPAPQAALASAATGPFFAIGAPVFGRHTSGRFDGTPCLDLFRATAGSDFHGEKVAPDRHFGSVGMDPAEFKALELRRA